MTIEKPFKKGADFERLRKVIMRESGTGPVPIIELGADTEIMAKVSGFDFPLPRAKDPIASYISHAQMAFDYKDLQTALRPDLVKLFLQLPEAVREELLLSIKMIDLSLAYSVAVGYDYVTAYPIVPLQRTLPRSAGNPQQPGTMRNWQDEHQGIITNREEFERYPWPSVDKINLFPIEYLADKLPEGMKIMVFYFGIFEDIRALMGFENMAIKSIEQPELLDDILEQLTIIAESAVSKCAEHPAVGAIFYGEDMGFNTSLMLSPKFMRKYVIPRHKRIADACHKHNKPFLFHSCGDIDVLMNDLIEEVGIDAKHSFQDNIMPVEEVYKKYGDKVAILGGVDVDLLARGTVEQVRKRTREILEVCGTGGGFAIGSGNSVTNFCKIENYYAMLDETRKWNEEHGWK